MQRVLYFTCQGTMPFNGRLGRVRHSLCNRAVVDTLLGSGLKLESKRENVYTSERERSVLHSERERFDSRAETKH